MPSALQLDHRFRWALYMVFAVLLITGAAWLIADAAKDSPSGEFWQPISVGLLTIHGGTAMLALLLVGALIPVHILRAWRSQRNRGSGSAMATCSAILIVTAFALYYAGSDTIRPWISDLHIAFGLFLPALFAAHIWLGRRSSRTPPATNSGQRPHHPDGVFTPRPPPSAR